MDIWGGQNVRDGQRFFFTTSHVNYDRQMRTTNDDEPPQKQWTMTMTNDDDMKHNDYK